MSPQAAPSLLTRLDLRGVTGDLRDRLPAPVVVDDEAATAAVRTILESVRERGDAAVRDHTARFDRVALDELRVPPEEVKAAVEAVAPELRSALEGAYDNIVAYHRTQLHDDAGYRRGGVSVHELRRPVDRAGLYAPGGRAALASSVLMTAAPARVAGVAELALCSPPGPDGRVAPSVLAAAAVAGIDEVYRVGGAQAIAALAYGTGTIRPVDVIVGPGNRYVAIAQRLVAGQGAVGVPSAFAGPSEVAVVADGSAPAAYAAVDLVVQAEHGPDGLAYLITWSEGAAAEIAAEVDRLVAESPRRADLLSTLRRGGYCVLVDDAVRAMDVANVVAAEHLELITEDPHALLPMVRAAGAVFVGPWSPASVGDYAAGPNHVLPTARSARFGSALRVDDFCKHIHVIDVGRDGLAELAPHVTALADAEGLPAHGESVRLRLAGGTS